MFPKLISGAFFLALRILFRKKGNTWTILFPKTLPKDSHGVELRILATWKQKKCFPTSFWFQYLQFTTVYLNLKHIWDSLLMQFTASICKKLTWAQKSIWDVPFLAGIRAFHTHLCNINSSCTQLDISSSKKGFFFLKCNFWNKTAINNNKCIYFLCFLFCTLICFVTFLKTNLFI